MQCPKCQFENREGRKFCGQCGAKLGWKCPECGFDNEADEKFCGGCGKALEEPSQPQAMTPVTSVVPAKLEELHSQLQRFIPTALSQRMQAEAPIEGENRLVTAMFADISGFTPAAEAMSPEAVADLVNQCFKDIVDIICLGYEGSINRFLGDCVLAFFGAPITHENDPERAILAALDMHEALRKLNRNLSIGINTGMMYVGQIGTELYQEYTAEGHAINLAKRFQEAAGVGQIFVGETTYKFTQRAFEFEPLGELTLKGIQPARAYSVLKVAERPQKVRGIEGLQARLVGRDKEFATLLDCANRLIEEGQGQIVSIIGEAGIGKSRLAAELKEYFEGKEAKGQEGKGAREKEHEAEIPLAKLPTNQPLWLEGRCVSIGQSISYWPFLDILRSYLELSDDDDEAAMARKIEAQMQQLFPQAAEEVIPFIGNLLSVKLDEPHQQKLRYLSPEHLRRQTLLRLRDIFVALARQKPLILVLEDLHWADDVSLDALWLLLDELPMAPLMLLCIYRPEKEQRSWQLGKVALSKALERYTEINLRPLSQRESRQLIESLLTIENLPAPVKNEILEKSDGNPFFVEEVVRSLLEQDLLYQENGHWKAREEITAIHVPDTVQSVILARVDRLAEETKYVLQCASVIGRIFRYRLLGYISRQEQELSGNLAQLEDQELVYEERRVPELEYAFKHVLTQETTYQGILERHRREFHHQVAQGIETLYRERIEEYYEELAYHYTKSPDKSKALEYLTKAGKKCFGAYAMQEAIQYYTDAIELAHQISVDKEMIAELYQQRGEARDAIGEYEEGIEDYKEALKYTEKKDYRAMLYGGIAYAYNWHRADWKNAIKYGNLGRAELENADESRFAILAYMSIGSTYSIFSNADEAVRFYQEGIQIAQKMGDKEALLFLHTRILLSHRFQDDSSFEQGLALIPKVENPYILALAYHLIGVRHARYGNTPEARESYHKAIELAKKYNAGTLFYSYHYLGLLYEQVSQVDNAVVAYEKSWNATLRMRNLHIIYADNYPGRLFHYYQQRGETRKIGTMIEAFLDMMDKAMTKEETEADSPFVQFFDTVEGTYRGRKQIGYTAIVPSDELRAECQQRLEKGLERSDNRMAIIWYLYQLMIFHLACGNLEHTKSYAYRLVDMDAKIGSPMVKTFLVVDEIESANQVVVDTLQAANQSGKDFVQSLQHAESLYGRFGYQDAFRQLCRQFKSENTSMLQQLNLTQLCLEPGQPSDDYGTLESADVFDGNVLSSEWEWINPTGDCSYAMLSPSGLQITVPPGRAWSNHRLDAPRLLQKNSGDFAIETKISDGDRGGKFGGLSVWSKNERYIHFDMHSSSIWDGGVHLEFSRGQEWEFAGRGRFEAETLTLRLERHGHRFSGCCSVDGENWLTCGWVDLPMDDPIQVGIHALCLQPATSTRFEYFKILRRDS